MASSFVILWNLCRYKFKNYQFVLALVFAIEEINRNPDLLPNTTIGYDIYNIPFTEKNILYHAFNWHTGKIKSFPNFDCGHKRKSPAILTGPSWSTSAHIGTFLQLYKIPQVRNGIWDLWDMYPLLTLQVSVNVK